MEAKTSEDCRRKRVEKTNRCASMQNNVPVGLGPVPIMYLAVVLIILPVKRDAFYLAFKLCGCVFFASD